MENRVFQVFNLVVASACRTFRSNPASFNARAWQTFLRKLQEKGYQVWAPEMGRFASIPTTILLSVSFPLQPEQDVKTDFYGVARELGLRFESGDCFFLQPTVRLASAAKEETPLSRS